MNQSGTLILDNKQNRNIGTFLQREITPDSELCIVSAYFTIYAYERLKEQLDQVKSVRFLFGEPSFLKNVDPEKSDSKSFRIERDDTLSLANVLQQKELAKRCYQWIKEKVEIKSMVKPDFLHGKMYHIQPINNGQPKAVIGSSNFTVRGLGLSKQANLELNMIVNDNRDMKALKDWFDLIWEGKMEKVEVEDVKEKVLEYLEEIYVDKSPEFIYFKTLYHIFHQKLKGKADIENISEKIGLTKTDLWNMLYDFQKEGVKASIHKLLNYNGCILADSVGLGKTFEALAVIKYFELQNNRVMVLCPKKLEQNWLVYTQNDDRNILHKDRLNYDVFAHTDLTRTAGTAAGGLELSNVNWGNYGLVVIDESHNFRNNGKSTDKRLSRYDKLMNEIIKNGVKTKVLLLSATPVNISLKDLRNQIYFITEGRDDAFKDNLGIDNIGNLLKEAQRKFTQWADKKKNPNPTNKHLLDILGADFFTLLSELSIARSRKQIKNHFAQNNTILFPKRLNNINESTDIDKDNRFPSFEAVNQQISGYSLAIFNPAKYVKNEFRHEYGLLTDEEKKEKEKKAKNQTTQKRKGEENFNQDDRERSLIGMIKVGFLKRLESSISSFAITLDATIQKMIHLENKINHFRKDNKQDISIGVENIFDSENEDEEIAEAQEITVGKKIAYQLKHIDLETWTTDLRKDRENLDLICASAQRVSPEKDLKLLKLKEVIQHKVKNPINENNKKVLIFTAYADTAKYLYENIANWAKQELNIYSALVTGTQQNQTNLEDGNLKNPTRFENLLINFSPISKKRELMKDCPKDKEIDILIATDCISEGQNLQDCDFVINYDIHWNPVRLIQRFGRIDRIGSKNQQIQMLNFWPTKHLDEYLNLETRVKARMVLVDVTATNDDNILSENNEAENEKNELNYRAEQLKKLSETPLDLEDLDDDLNFSEFSIDEFLEELKNYLSQDKFKNSPNGLYGIIPNPNGIYKKLCHVDLFTEQNAQNGVIFCLLQKDTKKQIEQFNPLKNIFLIWLNEDGTTKFTFTEPKKILTLFRKLATPYKQPLEELSKVFDKETNNGKNMEKYNELLQKALECIKQKASEKNLSGLFGIGNNKVVSNKEIKNNNDFELITWLIIK
jgi:superfamily II DNA or RNA helicase